MPKVTITLEDTHKDGKAIVHVNFATDLSGAPADAPASDAMMHGLCIARLWQCRSLPNMMPHVCGDALAQRAAIVKALAAAPPLQDNKPPLRDVTHGGGATEPPTAA